MLFSACNIETLKIFYVLYSWRSMCAKLGYQKVTKFATEHWCISKWHLLREKSRGAQTKIVESACGGVLSFAVMMMLTAADDGKCATARDLAISVQMQPRTSCVSFNRAGAGRTSYTIHACVRNELKTPHTRAPRMNKITRLGVVCVMTPVRACMHHSAPLQIAAWIIVLKLFHETTLAAPRR